MKALRTIRLDASDTFVFETAAEPGEWAVSGAFVFASVDPATLKGKARAQFRSGFLGIQSLGWSTLVEVVETTEQERARAVDVLTQHLKAQFGAPNLETARAAAEQEIDFATSLAEHPSGMLAAVTRTVEAGSIRETFRSLRPAANRPPSAFAFLLASDEGEGPTEEVDLANLAKRAPR
jgi:Family of unknown function (DUF6505)